MTSTQDKGILEHHDYDPIDIVEACRQRCDYSAAFHLFHEMLQNDNVTYYELFVYGALLITVGKSVSAIKSFQAALALRPTKYWEHLLNGLVLMLRGKHEKSRDEFILSVVHIGRNEAGVEAYAYLAYLELTYDNVDEAMVWLEKAKNAADSATRMHLPTISQSDRATIANNLGIAFERRGEMKSALECYNLSASIYKDSVLLLISRIRYYFNTNHFEELLTDCEHALALNPTDPEMLSDLHTFKGYAKHCLKKHSEGMIDLEKATIAQPQNYFSFMVKAHIQLVNNEPALATLDQGISSCDSREGLEKLFSMKDRHFTLSDRERNISLAVKTGVLSRIS